MDGVKSDLKRMLEIQNNLVKHIKKDLKKDEDHLYMATMLLKHAMVLYKNLLTDEEIEDMLGHVIDSLPQYDCVELTKVINKTMH